MCQVGKNKSNKFEPVLKLILKEHHVIKTSVIEKLYYDALEAKPIYIFNNLNVYD